MYDTTIKQGDEKMFRVSLEMLTEAANELHTDATQLRTCMDTLQSVIFSLGEFSYMEETRQELLLAKERLETEANQAELLEHSLRNISEQYWRTDRRASDYCEDVRRSLPRERVFVQDLGWLQGMRILL